MAMASLYQHVLPALPAVEFALEEGKRLFVEALQSKTLQGFFYLISCFQTQSDLAFCGLTSLSIVLNALAMDPGQQWKGPSRWFDESMLECCEPLDKVKAVGKVRPPEGTTCLAVNWDDAGTQRRARPSLTSQ
ncbi:hypothetical protein E2562_018221 [Oryza meyeriana var. granulata]|uniref:glutathione gamma-glutamylcysteinyltransferase n=1 Tax=Oryza meyeriana var. granulata TaxID=110450 RepID=A0A6G1CGP5_9ORYZ|nr:hypothetical protein E2562_018221 [Oryza meyeriana var. granulata]